MIMVYISIESRKGGVGKTTVSLTLAETLIQKGYQVLVVDLDIIGTRIDSGFIEANSEKIHEVKRDGKTLNLLELFKNEFMLGRNLPVFSNSLSSSVGYLTYELGKCNFLGSNIYDNNSDVPLEDPRILYDAFHAYWLLEFVMELAQTFGSAIEERKVAVIFDNSPGFSSMESVINDKLTQLGPEKGKIMLVSTIDPQDISACRQSKGAIEKLFDDKVAAGRYYRALIDDRFETKLKSKAFDAVWDNLCASNGQEPKYYTEEHVNQPPFTSILVNKVPRNLYEELYQKKLIKRPDEIAAPFSNHLLCFFSNPLLLSKGIQHHTYLGDGYKNYILSADVNSIFDDDSNYHKMCEFTKLSGLRNIFEEGWSPLSPFTKLLDYFKRQEIIKADGTWRFPYSDLPLRKLSDNLNNEVETVRRFVLDNINSNAELAAKIPEVVSFVTKSIKESAGRNEINFHPESEILAPYDEFIVCFGLAVYKLHVYEMTCTVLNNLMLYCFEEAERMETLDVAAINSLVSEMIEGRSLGTQKEKELSAILANHKNARELTDAIEQILKVWGI